MKSSLLTSLILKSDEWDEGKHPRGERGRWVYHGTSSIHLDAIAREGLQPRRHKGLGEGTAVHVTMDPRMAVQEAHYTVYGDQHSDAPGVGGEPIVFKIDTKHKSFKAAKPFIVDQEYGDPYYRHELHAFKTTKGIHPDAIVSAHKVSIHSDKLFGEEIKFKSR